MGHRVHSTVRVTDLNDAQAAKWMASKLPWDGTLPRPAIFFTFDQALKAARSPSDPDDVRGKAIKLFDILEQRTVVHVELAAFLQYPKNHFKLQAKTNENWLDVLLELVSDWESLNAVAQNAYKAVGRDILHNGVHTARNWQEYKQNSCVSRPRNALRASSASDQASSESALETLYDSLSGYTPSSEYGGKSTAWGWVQDSMAKGARETATCSSIIDHSDVVSSRTS
jgi:hypothetical protein